MNRYLNLLFISLLCTLIACKKHSTFSGKITNSADGQAVEGVEVRLRFLKGKKGGGSELVAKDEQTTSSNGEYALEVEGKNAESAYLDVKKDRYAPSQYKSFDPGDCDEVDFVLNPYDAWLSVTFENQSDNLAKNIYFNYTGPYLEGSPYCSNSGCGPFVIQPKASHTEVMRIPGGAEITINWDTKTGAGSVPNQKAVNCSRNDTTFVTIDF